MIMSLFLYMFIFVFSFIFIFIIRSISITFNWKRPICSLLFRLRLRSIDWSNETKRRIVLASLVKGAYSLEHERQGKKLESSSWTDYGFQLHGRLVEKYDESYYGAIFRNKYPYPSKSGVTPPKFVIAFRGTVLTTKTGARDMVLNAKLVCHILHKSSRVEDAIANVLKVVDLAGGPEHVWLAGHSLGSAISLAVWRELILNKKFGLETFLFNPPIVSSPNEFSRGVGLFAKCILTSVLNFVIQQSRVPEETDDNFNKLSSWAPHLFINESDLICQGYTSYFEHRKIMGACAAQYSVIGLIAEAAGKDLEPIHLIPSANLTIAKSSSDRFEAHKLKRWLEQDLQCRMESYRTNDNTQSI